MKALLVLEDGFTLEGKSFTGDFETGGEVIFTTGMAGYQEVITDPSYYGQMVCMTYPLIGNYGICPEDMESAGVQAEALLVKECCKQPSNWRSRQSLPDFLQAGGKAGVEGLDTRALSRHLRINGAMRGLISTRQTDPRALREQAQALPLMQGRKLTPFTAAQKPYAWIDNAPREVTLGPDGAYAWRGKGLRLLVYDFGLAWSVLRQLHEAGFECLAVPPTFSVQAAKASGAQAVFLSNGPGDPAALVDESAVVRELTRVFPVAGICLGYQLMARALGASTDRLTSAHHGCNYPVKDLTDESVEISTQNHGFHVLVDGASEVEVTHVNLNDHSVEGLRHKTLPVMGMQYLPGAVDPRDGGVFLRRFREMIDKN